MDKDTALKLEIGDVLAYKGDARDLGDVTDANGEVVVIVWRKDDSREVWDVDAMQKIEPVTMAADRKGKQ